MSRLLTLLDLLAPFFILSSLGLLPLNLYLESTAPVCSIEKEGTLSATLRVSLYPRMRVLHLPIGHRLNRRAGDYRRLDVSQRHINTEPMVYVTFRLHVFRE